MPELHHSEAPCPAPIRAFGCRRVTLDMRAWYDRADQFKGLPRGTGDHYSYLYAFKEAEPHLGLPPQTYKLIDWLVVANSKPQDWEEGSRPIAWPCTRFRANLNSTSPPTATRCIRR